MEKERSITSLMSSFARAYHCENEEFPVFSDTVARKLMTDDEYNMISNYVLGGISFFAPEKKDTFKDEKDALRYLVNTHLAPTVLCRSTYCEKVLKTLIATGCEQYVILGAGLDTFAFREREILKKCKVYEVDMPQTQNDKIQRLGRAKISIPENLSFIGADFTKDNIAQKLLENGFDKRKKTFFSYLGVSYYLYRDDIENTLKTLSEIMSDGSEIVFDYADSNLFMSKEKRVQNMIAMAKAGGEEMKSSFSYMSMELMLSDLGFLVYEHLTPSVIQKEIIKNADMKAFEHINYVLAVKKM